MAVLKLSVTKKMIGKVESLVYLMLHHWRYILIFRKISWKSRVFSPLSIEGGKNIQIGRKVVIQKKTWLAAMPHTNQIPNLTIEDGCMIGNFNHIYCTGKITICKYVLTADKVYISDNIHTYENINLPILQQPVKQLKEIVIGQGAWLGENVCVIGASVGKGSVIGANSVVNKDIPDYCIAVGAPAKVIKKYNFDTKKWERQF